MILNCNFEELQALVSGADLLLAGAGDPSQSAVVAPIICGASNGSASSSPWSITHS